MEDAASWLNYLCHLSLSAHFDRPLYLFRDTTGLFFLFRLRVCVFVDRHQVRGKLIYM